MEPEPEPRQSGSRVSSLKQDVLAPLSHPDPVATGQSHHFPRRAQAGEKRMELKVKRLELKTWLFRLRLCNSSKLFIFPEPWFLHLKR